MSKKGLLLIVVAAGAALVIWYVNAPDEPGVTPSESQRAQPRTVADAWRARSSEQQNETAFTTLRPAPAIDERAVRDALQEVRIDDNGNVVLDHRVLTALRNGIASLGPMDADRIAELQQVIRDGLPPPAGEQAATLVGRYYEYQLAARSLPDAGRGDLAQAEAQLDRLVELRKAYFGEDAAEKLFGDEQAYARFTLASMQITSDPTLSPEEKEQRQQALYQQLPEHLRPVGAPSEPQPMELPAGFAARYAAFEREKRAILAAGLTEEDKNAQIERLLHEYFAPDEIDLALRYDPDAAR